ncbi:hypothetical protein JAAARDRAFT_30163 [Jaapia argillacea MUCL 33604]|uniref:DUF202 domain-containing protein n=1 Tax=Jaapia argillacea MUCL 33604 TaxID=933084 RepID=A0A067QI33_9AGAM|nr:hypothetical protein JAAARDRAFT_30163 [Jaapia argillacea MUCL 33604]
MACQPRIDTPENGELSFPNTPEAGVSALSLSERASTSTSSTPLISHPNKPSIPRYLLPRQTMGDEKASATHKPVENLARDSPPAPPPTPTHDGQDSHNDCTRRNQPPRFDIPSSVPTPKKRYNKEGWGKWLESKLELSVVLDNRGSVARDHLASERTFLAYVRTSLAIASMGVAIVQLFTLSAAKSTNIRMYAHPIGATAVFLGLLTLAAGVTRYFSVQSSLTKGTFPVARFFMISMAVVLATLICIVFGILVAVRP